MVLRLLLILIAIELAALIALLSYVLGMNLFHVVDLVIKTLHL